MFFYLSFLRPPPTQAPPSSPILITPQISNDLRTEPFESTQDLYYAWVHDPFQSVAGNAAPPTIGANIPPKMTVTAKLTTYRTSTAYKEIPVPVPKGVREGQAWKLVLSTSNRSCPPDCVIRLGDDTTGSGVPLPVLSMPVLFTAKSGRWAPKQEQIERMYGFSLTKPSVATPPTEPTAPQNVTQHVSLRIREQTSFDLDKKIWDSGIGLSSWLIQLAEDNVNREQFCNERATQALESLKNTLSSASKKRILDLGSGSGIVALILAAIRQNRNTSDVQDDHLATDLESAIPLLQHNISANQRAYTNVSLSSGVLDWNEDFQNQVGEDCIFDLVVMADVTYNTASFPFLLHTLKSIITASGARRPQFVLGYKQRDNDERSWWDMAKLGGLDFVQIGEVPGYGGAPVEIWTT